MLKINDYSLFEKYFYFLHIVKEFFLNNEFIEVYTPVLVQCPGTEVHLDYFNTYWKGYTSKPRKLFLRSSPELHMKQLLAMGFSKIFQIAPSFRNGYELSNWHNPEFLMLEWYLTDIGFDAFIDHTQEFLKFTYERLKQKYPDEIKFIFTDNIKRISISEAFKDFADIELKDGDEDLAKIAKSKGIVSVNINDDFETAFFKILIEKVEPNLEKIGLCVLYDYPASQAALSSVINGWAKRFEFYYKRVELCNAFLELIDPIENKKRIRQVLKKRKLLGKPSIKEDKNFYFILKDNHGLPSSCGNALGLDRWFAILLGYDEIIIPKLWDIFA